MSARIEPGCASQGSAARRAGRDRARDEDDAADLPGQGGHEHRGRAETGAVSGADSETALIPEMGTRAEVWAAVGAEANITASNMFFIWSVSCAGVPAGTA